MDSNLPRGTTFYDPLVRVHFDGACEPPSGGGIATYGFVAEGEGMEHEEFGPAVRPGVGHATNNVAEYVAATRALEYLASRGYTGRVQVLGDSQLVIRQMQGEYAVRADHLKDYHEHLTALARRFAQVEFLWVPREQNERADTLSKRAISEVQGDLRRRGLRGPERTFGSDSKPDSRRRDGD
jgi:ribonuclease HI